MRWRTIAAACLGLAALSAGAQVHRCKDPSGELVFSDRPCTNTQTGGMIQLRPSAREVERERRQAAEANARKQDRQDAQATAAAGAKPAASAAQPVAQGPNVNPYQCRKAKEELDLAVSLRTLTPEEKRIRVHGEQVKVAGACGTTPPGALPPAPVAAKPKLPPFTGFTHCDPGFCYDNRGLPYSKSGPDFLIAPDGKTCSRAGNMWNCG